MADYELKFTVSSPGNYPTFVEFSPSGRFLVVGYRDSSLYILDRRAGFHPTLSATTPAIPTALVWETHKAFYVGFDDGSFMHYQLDLKQKKLAVGVVNSLFRGSFPVTAIALDGESKTLVLSVGPGVYAFRRTRTIGMCSPADDLEHTLTPPKVTFASSPSYRAVLNFLQATLEVQHHQFRDLSVLHRTIHLWLRFAAKT